jgi:hypothetical protein
MRTEKVMGGGDMGRREPGRRRGDDAHPESFVWGVTNADFR